MSQASDRRTHEFLAIADQFKLGVLVTESSHPVTAHLSDTAKESIPAALGELFDVDGDVLRTYREAVDSGRLPGIAATVRDALRAGGKVVFTGCGSTGRLSIQLVSIWRDFWQRQNRERAAAYENRAFSAMAGGDFALIKSVEGFEDFVAFGRRQLADLGVEAGDVVFAITEGGETSFVIGTAWEALDRGAKVYFVYNNPDEVLRANVERSREVIDEPRIEKLNLTTGPMAISGSTRMQATTIQLCVLLTVLEMVVTELMGLQRDLESIPGRFAIGLERVYAALQSARLRESLARLVELEEGVYRAGHKNNYFADQLGIDVLTDTTERSPTYCTPPFRKFDDASASESWSYLFLPYEETPTAWERLLKRKPDPIEWPDEDVRALVGPEKAERSIQIVHRIGMRELLRFRIGLDGLPFRPLGPGDSAVGITAHDERDSLQRPGGFHRMQLEAARRAGARIGILAVMLETYVEQERPRIAEEYPDAVVVTLPVPGTGFLLDGVTRVAVKMLLNALSTCTMVRLGRVMGNTMIWVVPSNLKLIDRSTRYIARLTGLPYEKACRLLHEVIEYVQPRMLADQAYPPVVGVAVLRAGEGLTNDEAEAKLAAGI